MNDAPSSSSEPLEAHSSVSVKERGSLSRKTLQVRGGVSRGVWAIADQAVISLSSLLATVVIGRFAGAESLGQYVVGFSIAVTFSCLVRALIVAPFGVFIFRAPEADRCVMRSAMWLQAGSVIALTVVLGMLASVAVELFDVSISGKMLMAVTCIVTGMMAREIARQACFAELRFASAMGGDVVSSLLTIGGIAGLWYFERLTPALALVAVGTAGWIASAGWWIRIPLNNGIDVSETIRRWSTTWRFGRWEALGQTCQVLQGYVLSWILAISSGFEAAGFYAATWSIVQLASPFAQGAGNAMGPSLARAFADHGSVQLRKTTRHLTMAALGASIVYLIAIAIVGPELFQFAYGDQYPRPTSLLIVLAGVVCVSVISMAITKAIVILERPHHIFLIQAGVLAGIVGCSLALGSMYGLIGAAIGLLTAQIGGLAAKVWAYRATAASQER
ncbi:hypothetical protein N9N28_13190 [Rubripirellula amarantea]|uniref:Colanic acid exporter n=1 Tax=Rubripirellula amarantea TaxID=2527999 RepID=A0A5C5WHZ9_9BACT|nr:hypothetical protein [Rubripirellula amarantea]MDA8745580.1 hypothetical protein [Rubripirellula amarantea]TWT49715.1 colanic acid exporter [Rubripirellula amarantea]